MFSLLITTILLSSLHSCSHGRRLSDEEVATDIFHNENSNEVEPVPLVQVNPALDEELKDVSRSLMTLLQHPWGPEGAPLVYVEDFSSPEDNVPNFSGPVPSKRSRYYRRYPWKRQNSRSRTYEADNRYLCQPSREDVFKLLVALHETRAGSFDRSINFCNRRRSATTVFTNLRFLGKK